MMMFVRLTRGCPFTVVPCRNLAVPNLSGTMSGSDGQATRNLPRAAFARMNGWDGVWVGVEAVVVVRTVQIKKGGKRGGQGREA